MRIQNIACAAVLSLLSGCATTSVSKKHFQEDSYARYYKGGSGKVLRVEADGTVLDVGCIPMEFCKDTPRQDLPTSYCKISELGKVQKIGNEWDIAAYTIEPETGGGNCRPLMAPLINAFEHPRFGSFGDDAWESNVNSYHSCWNRVWEVPTAIVVYPTVAGIMIVLITSPVWVPLILLL